MPASRLHRIVDSTTRSAHSNHTSIHSGLCNQVGICSVDVRGHFLEHRSHLVGGQIRERLAFALSKAAIVESEHIDPCGRKLPSQSIPNLALAVALVQQQNTGPGL